MLDASNLMEIAALDRYEFVRDSFLQRRESRIFDGESPKKTKDAKESDKDGEKKVPAAEKKTSQIDTGAAPDAPALSSETTVKELTPVTVAATESGLQQ